MLNARHGFSVVELVVIMLFVAVLVTIGLPTAVSSSPELDVDVAARTLARDLEQLRMRAISAKRRVRIGFDPSSAFYTAFMDVTPSRQGVINETEDEVRQSKLIARASRRGLPGVVLREGVIFGGGEASTGPFGESVTSAVTLEDHRLEFDARGLVDPPGLGGVVYFSHAADPSAVAAVTISGASALRVWRYRGGRWIR